MAKYKQLTHEQRKQIETGLQQQDSFKKIAETIGKDCSTISKEVRSHLIYRKTGAYGKPFNDCSLRKKCRQIDICPTCSASKRRPLYCSFCGRCLHTCVSYHKQVCPKLSKPPYVCNGCKQQRLCTLEKKFYNAALAQKEYEDVLSESRQGRTMKDLNAFMTSHPDTPVVQIDSVEGTKGGAVLLTITFVTDGLQIAFRRDHNDAQSVITVFNQGVDLTAYQQEQIDLMMSHINSYRGKTLGNKSPYEMFSFQYGENLLKKIGLRKIPPDEIILSPRLFK